MLKTYDVHNGIAYWYRYVDAAAVADRLEAEGASDAQVVAAEFGYTVRLQMHDRSTFRSVGPNTTPAVFRALTEGF